MKKIFLFLALTQLIGCEDKADFYKNGKAYKITSTCLDKHKEARTATSISRYYGSYEYTYFVWVCTREKVDTIEMEEYGR